MGCSPPLAHKEGTCPPGVPAGACGWRRTGCTRETEKGGTGGGMGMQAQGGRGEQGRSQSRREEGSGSV